MAWMYTVLLIVNFTEVSVLAADFKFHRALIGQSNVREGKVSGDSFTLQLEVEPIMP